MPSRLVFKLCIHSSHANNVRPGSLLHAVIDLLSASPPACSFARPTWYLQNDSAADKAESCAVCLVDGMWHQLLFSDIVIFELPDQSCIGTPAIIFRTIFMHVPRGISASYLQTLEVVNHSTDVWTHFLHALKAKIQRQAASNCPCQSRH